MKKINMLLKVVEDGVETPFEIDTAMEPDGKTRWIQIWKGEQLLRQPKSMEEAIDEVEELLTLGEIGIKIQGGNDYGRDKKKR